MKSKKIALKADNIGKCYRIGVKDEIHDNISSAIVDFIKSPLTNYRKYRSLYKFDDVTFPGPEDQGGNSADIFWALGDVSFEVHAGESLAVIGKNGSGKSTLLKLLCRITRPTCGRALVRGKVSSLLEVGTGFHPELTGRENVYLNGTILGMRKIEVDQKFDEIVAFSGIEKFIDTPVKRYSSGMKVRLAFSVAAHLEPEILIVDEVLAVGDADFQSKCLSKMQDVGQHGRTVIFVSHNMQAVTRLCQRAIWLDKGQIVADGPAEQIVSEYLNSASGTSAKREWTDPEKAPGGEVARLRSIRICSDDDGQVAESYDIRKPIAVKMEYDVLQSGHVLLPHFHLHNEMGEHVFVSLDLEPEWRNKPRPVGRYKSIAIIPGNFLSEGMMFVSPALGTVSPRVRQFYESHAVAFNVIDSLEGDSARGDWAIKMGGVVRPLLDWKTQHDENF